MNEILKQIGYDIKDVRLRRHLTQKQFVDLFNQTDPTEITMKVMSLSTYERGQTKITAEKYLKIMSLKYE